MIEDRFDPVNPVDPVKSHFNIPRRKKMQRKLDKTVYVTKRQFLIPFPDCPLLSGDSMLYGQKRETDD
jgi:hypothetical protein